MLFLENISSILLGIHLVTAIVSLIALLAAFSYIVLASNKDWKTGVKASILGAWGYIVTFVLGLLIYPVFRVKVRAADFDKVRPWATGIFEVKEHIGAIALFAAIAVIVLAGSTNDKSEDNRKKLFTFLVSTVTLVFVIKFIAGFVLTVLNRM
ncbi:hypothetical protein COY62_03700 [bacterium (Candidatus Howlettbacteria) CG_4_10_14_0_8_um_filter_40_9]|nr:MAG: hypothetical protein COY62_03700 [bacterium (Candidatus Howlettbacteria) CG_4_10_14_0_8_um_filter_40_9]